MTLAPGERVTLTKTHNLRPVTTRVRHPGHHRVMLQVKGQAVAEADFQRLS